jgi:hypothetical protein
MARNQAILLSQLLSSLSFSSAALACPRAQVDASIPLGTSSRRRAFNFRIWLIRKIAPLE